MGKKIITSEKVYGETPAGGDYSEIYYFDENWNSCDKSVAVRFKIRECRNDGQLVMETSAGL